MNRVLTVVPTAAVLCVRQQTLSKRQRHLNRNPLSKLQHSLRLVLLHPFPQAAAAAAAAGSEALIAERLHALAPWLAAAIKAGPVFRAILMRPLRPCPFFDDLFCLNVKRISYWWWGSAVLSHKTA